MALAALLPVLMEALAAVGVTAEAAAATTAARAAATGAATAVENAAAQTAAKAAAGSATAAAEGTATKAAAAQASGQNPGMGQMFSKLWESLAGKGAEKTAAEQARNAAFDAANLGVPTQNPTRDYKSSSDKAAEDAAGKIKDKVIGGVTAMGSSLVANTVGSVIGNFVNNQQNTTQVQPGAQQGVVTKSFEKMGAGPAGQRVAGLAQGGLNKALDTAMSLPGPGFKAATGVAGMLVNNLPGVSQVKKLAGMFAEVVETGIKLPGMMEDWGKELLAGQQHLAAFNGKIGVAFAEAERRDILRNVESGANTGDSTKMLSGALSDLKDEMQPIRDLATNGLNVLATAAIKIVTLGVQAVRILSPGLETLLWFQDNWPWGEGKDKESDLPMFIQFMNRLENRTGPRAPKR